jgi:hypothetical protein
VGAGVAGDDLFEAALCGGEIRAEEDAAHGFGDSGPLVEARDVGLGVLLEMELAALPGDGGEDRGTGRPSHQDDKPAIARREPLPLRLPTPGRHY